MIDLESWEVLQAIDSHPTINQMNTLLPSIQNVVYGQAVNRLAMEPYLTDEMVTNFRANQTMLHQMRAELGCMSIDTPANVHDQLRMLNQRMDTMEATLSTLEKAFFLLQRQLGFAETLRVPEAEPVEERLDEHGPD